MPKPKPSPPDAGAIRNRVKELRNVRASDLLPNPKNWRRHPEAQSTAIQGVLAEIGYADALIAYETPEGLMLIDGHLRAETTPDQTVPVLVLDVDEDEADKLLATLDPLVGMAERDSAAVIDLLETINAEDERVADLLETMRKTAVAELEGGGPEEPKSRALPNVVVKYELVFDDEAQQTRFYEFLRRLKTRAPGETIAARLDAFIEGLGWED